MDGYVRSFPSLRVAVGALAAILLVLVGAAAMQEWFDLYLIMVGLFFVSVVGRHFLKRTRKSAQGLDADPDEAGERA